MIEDDVVKGNVIEDNLEIEDTTMEINHKDVISDEEKKERERLSKLFDEFDEEEDEDTLLEDYGLPNDIVLLLKEAGYYQKSDFELTSDEELLEIDCVNKEILSEIRKI